MSPLTETSHGQHTFATLQPELDTNLRALRWVATETECREETYSVQGPQVRSVTMLDEYLNHHTQMIVIGLSTKNSVSGRWHLLNNAVIHNCCIVVGKIIIYIFDSVHIKP